MRGAWIKLLLALLCRLLFHLCPQFPHDCSDPASGSFFGTAKIPRGLHVTAFCYFKRTGTMFDGKGSNHLYYSKK